MLRPRFPVGLSYRRIDRSLRGSLRGIESKLNASCTANGGGNDNVLCRSPHQSGRACPNLSGSIEPDRRTAHRVRHETSRGAITGACRPADRDANVPNCTRTAPTHIAFQGEFGSTIAERRPMLNLCGYANRTRPSLRPAAAWNSASPRAQQPVGPVDFRAFGGRAISLASKRIPKSLLRVRTTLYRLDRKIYGGEYLCLCEVLEWLAMGSEGLRTADAIATGDRNFSHARSRSPASLD